MTSNPKRTVVRAAGLLLSGALWGASCVAQALAPSAQSVQSAQGGQGVQQAMPVSASASGKVVVAGVVPDEATRVAVLADKRVIVTDTPQKVVQFEHPFIRQFFQGERGLRAMAPPAIAKDR